MHLRCSFPKFLKHVSWVMLGLLAVVGIMGALVMLLSLAYLGAQWGANSLGYKFVLPQDLQKDVITVSGVVVTALVALSGIRLQNESADKRHKVDAQLSLRKDIFLDAAARSAEQYQALLHLALNDEADEHKKLQEVSRNAGSSFAKVQMVASRTTINALLDTNEQYARSLLIVMGWKVRYPLEVHGNHLARMRLFHVEAVKYLQKCWQFVVEARQELNSEFDDAERYLSDMNASMSRLLGYIDDLEHQLGEGC